MDNPTEHPSIHTDDSEEKPDTRPADLKPHEPSAYNPERPDTAILSASNLLRRANQSRAANGTVAFGQHELLLVIRGMVERVMMNDAQSILLGRGDPQIRFHPDVDLTPYGALDRGVSREHARLLISEERLYVIDLGSTNGTFLGGQRLEPDTPTLIGKGDELLLGRLAIQVLFR